MKGESEMITIFRILYVVLIGYLIYTMVKRGGCCGGHGHGHGNSHGQSSRSHQGSCCDSSNKSKKIISEDDKKNAIDI